MSRFPLSDAAVAIDVSTLPTDLKSIKDEKGVADLPMRVKGPFCLAISAERKGDKARAELKLNEAVAAEINPEFA